MSVVNPRLSISIDEMADRYDVVVIGSGYGGSVHASRLARAKKRDGTAVSVAVLERGRELQPGEYPENPIEAAEHFQIEFGDHREGREDALYQFHADSDVSVFKGCGLGGGSLVNANVALTADPRVFDDPVWPAALRDDRTLGLARGFERARAMLRPTPYPDEFPSLPKLEVLEKMAASVSGVCTRPPINVNFLPIGPNHLGVMQAPCTGCGDCVSGCNVGAKNTLIMNYLPDARSRGAHIFTSIRVTGLSRASDRGWIVTYRRIGVGRELFNAPDEFVCADVVVVSGGALGSTELLLQSAKDLTLSLRLGERFTGNGDVLAFGYDLEDRVHGIGNGAHPTDPANPVGPCISGLIDLRDPRAPLSDGMVIEEGSIPGAMAMFMPEFLRASALVGARLNPDEGEAARLSHLEHETQSILLGPHHGAVDNTQTYLVMSHDGSNGRMVLDDGALRIRWPDIGARPSIARVNDQLAKATFARMGVYVEDPIWSKDIGQRLVTVHPLGGCAMGEDATTGVVNHKGQVFSGTSGTQVHEGLYVSDASIMPRSLGVNPLLTITAIAERNAALLVLDRGWILPTEEGIASPSDTTPAAEEPVAGIRFTETMKGTLEAIGEESPGSTPCEFTVTIETDDVVTLTTLPGHPATISGTVSASLLSSEPLEVRDGKFALFIDDSKEVGTKIMRYAMTLVSRDGRQWSFLGDKYVRDDTVLGLWTDTTTLYVNVNEKASGQSVATGVLKIQPADLMRQLRTMEVTGAVSLRTRLAAMARFGGYFAGSLYTVYGGVVSHYPFFDETHEQPVAARKKRELRAPVPTVYWFATADGKRLRLTRYQGGKKGPVLLIHGLGVSSRIFSIDTIDTNLVETLCQDGFDVWLVDFRASVDLPESSLRFNGDDVAIHDHPAALAEVLRLTGAADLQVVAHCFGANTFFMTLMRGLAGVRNVVFSQVAGHLEAPLANEIRAGLHLPDLLDTIGVKSLTAAVGPHPRWRDRLFDKVCAVNPAIPGTEHCDSAVCHRISFMYAPLYEHANLNELTHRTLEEQFGVANIAAFEHLTLMVRERKVVAHDGADCYLPSNPVALAANIRNAAMPILLIHGQLNRCYLPAGTLADLALIGEDGSDRVTRRVIPGYGHIDCIFGKNAAQDVYPHIVAQLNRNA